AKSSKPNEAENPHFFGQVSRVERQAILLLQALGSNYIALGAFAGGTLMALLGGGMDGMLSAGFQRALVLAGIALVFIGVAALVFGSIRLFQATQLSLTNLRTEAGIIRARSGAPLN
ncbi:MAG TPA: hypothetical protein VK633_05725, partial [Verrucomicrobiae bacterium]|nr:hypothetical protein [Verrucomicrobiae bacterium]